ncbi:hypothetical protein NKG05_07520 [Oerskovia sp. M15]
MHSARPPQPQTSTSDQPAQQPRSRAARVATGLTLAAALAATYALRRGGHHSPGGCRAGDPAVVVHETFDGTLLPAGWTPVEGAWRVESGRLVGTSTSQSQQSRLTFGSHLEDYRFEATVRFDQVANAGRWQALALDIPASGRSRGRRRRCARARRRPTGWSSRSAPRRTSGASPTSPRPLRRGHG